MTHFRIPLKEFDKERMKKQKTNAFTLARTFSNEAGLTNEKQIIKTSV